MGVDMLSGERVPYDEKPYTSMQLGVWRVLLNNESPWSFPELYWKDVLSKLSLLSRFMTDVYSLGPYLCISMILIHVWRSIEDALLLYCSSRLLTVIEAGITSGQPDVKAIVSATAARVLCLVLAASIQWFRDFMRPVIRSRVKLHFEELFLRADIGQDLATSQENSNKIHITSTEVWSAVPQLFDYISIIFSVVSQLAFGVHVFRFEGGGRFFVLLCIAKPLITAVCATSLSKRAYAFYASNAQYLRMLALRQLCGDSYREEIISGNLADYIVQEHDKAQQTFGDVSDDSITVQHETWKSPVWGIFIQIVGDLPMIYYAANVILNPSQFSVTSIAILQQTLGSLRYKLEQMLWEYTLFSQRLNVVQRAYESIIVTNKINDGPLSYPAEDCKDSRGMLLEVRNLCFEYPGSKSTRNAVKNVSFCIKPGQLVVIVGSNGSGKSTIIKLLSRLYDATSGDVMVDGRNIKDYRVSELRDATATLAQGHNIFPLTAAENIGVGYPAYVSNIEMIAHSAKQGGAFHLLSNLKQGFRTTLHPVHTGYTHRRDELNKRLRSDYDAMERSVNVSGGEQQRLVASRTFMRLKSEKIRFVTVDEPSSALDPQGEFDLFGELRNAKSGKTMIFVTHRFGHLTKHADLILCMKDGSLVESGTHTELISRGGEYSKLYNIQAQAFTGN